MDVSSLPQMEELPVYSLLSTPGEVASSWWEERAIMCSEARRRRVALGVI